MTTKIKNQLAQIQEILERVAVGEEMEMKDRKMALKLLAEVFYNTSSGADVSTIDASDRTPATYEIKVHTDNLNSDCTAKLTEKQYLNIKNLLCKNEKIQAIKFLRQYLNLSLIVAKHTVEDNSNWGIDSFKTVDYMFPLSREE